jgi:hypothetical protein
VTVVKRSTRAIVVRIEGCCLSMRCLVILLSTDLCQTTWCGNNMERCRHPLSRTKVMMRSETDDKIAGIGMEYDLGSGDQ